MIAAAVLTIAISGLSSALVSAMQLTRVNRESALAQQAARRAIEQVQSTPFADIFRTFNADPADDPGGAGTAAGPDFAVPGLAAQPGDADGLPGEIQFPTISVAGLEQLREDVADAELGMPRDLNADGAVDALDHKGNYLLLPVQVRVLWRGVAGNRLIEMATILSAR